MGTRHILFPRSTDIGRPIPPVEWFRLPVPRRRVCQARTISLCLSGSAAEPADGVATTGLSGETSWPGCRAPAMRSGFRTSMKHSAGSGAFLLGFSEVGIAFEFRIAIVCPGGRVLSLTPHVAFSFPDGRSRFRNLPFVRALSTGPGHRLARRLPTAGLSPRQVDPFFALTGCDAGGLRSFLVRPKPRDSIPTTLAHSSNDRSATDCVRDGPRFNRKDFA